MSVDDLIAQEFDMYLQFCRNASRHDEQEMLWKQLAHVTFYHMMELRATRAFRFTSPITIK